jgi:hypothetical protein
MLVVDCQTGHKSVSRLVTRMAKTVVGLNVSYSQLAIFSSGLAQPFNDWTEKHFAQGFAWRPGSVSFRTIVEAGEHSVEIDVVERVDPIGTDVVRAIEVPFEVPPDGAVEIASISDAVALSLPARQFLLRCEFPRSNDGGAQRVRLYFSTKDTPRFAVVKADAALNAAGELLTTANAASI